LYTPTAPPEIYPLSLHDALPIFELLDLDGVQWCGAATGSRPSTPYRRAIVCSDAGRLVKESSFWRALASRSHARASASKEESISDRKSTRLNSSHLVISYAVFCL